MKPVQITVSILKTSQLELLQFAGINTGIDTVTIEAANDDLTQHTEDTATDLTLTHHISHITDHPHITAFWVINPEIIVCHTHDHPTNLQGMDHADMIHTPAGHEEGYTPRRT